MKKAITLFLAALSLSACIKKHTCTCYTSKGASTVSSRTTNSKSDAEEFKLACENSDAAQKRLGGHCDYE